MVPYLLYRRSISFLIINVDWRITRKKAFLLFSNAMIKAFFMFDLQIVYAD